MRIFISLHLPCIQCFRTGVNFYMRFASVCNVEEEVVEDLEQERFTIRHLGVILNEYFN